MKTCIVLNHHLKQQSCLRDEMWTNGILVGMVYVSIPVVVQDKLVLSSNSNDSVYCKKSNVHCLLGFVAFHKSIDHWDAKEDSKSKLGLKRFCE
jgi:hypothetical protein